MSNIFDFIAANIRKHKLGLLFLCDIFLMLLSISLAALILWGNDISLVAVFFRQFWWVVPLSLAFRIGIFRNFGLYHWAWQYMSVREVISLVKAVFVSSTFIAFSIIAFRQMDFPFSILVIEAMLCFIFVGGVRLFIRTQKDAQTSISVEGKERRILIVGAGDAGEMILREMMKIPKLGYRPVGFVDDNPFKKGVLIHQLPVLGNCTEIPQIVADRKIDEVIIAIPSGSHREVRHIVEYCEQSTASFRIVPGIFELIGGSVHVSQIRNVEIEDLLGREPVKLDLQSISSYLSNATILVTGAGGSIGSEICRQVAMYSPVKLILLGKGESSIFDIEFELRNKFPFLSLNACIADIRDVSRIENIFKAEKPDVVFHAAAHKHVYLMERNPDEAVTNNIIGTKNIVDTSDRHKVKKFVMISTDKAVNPSSVMGATKRVAEMVVKAKALTSETKFVSVRFGNVLGSRGSVVPLFKKQIAAGGPLTVTHPEAKRYFMTIPEAVQLVIQAGAMGNGGETFVLDMGEPVKIVDLATDLIKLSGLEAGVDIDIRFIGLRPGEKLFEQLLTLEEGAKATKHEKIFVAKPTEVKVDDLMDGIRMLEVLARDGKGGEIKVKIRDIVPTYKEVVV